MKRVLVNLISEQTTPNFLFIKEMIQPGDTLLFISSRKYVSCIECIKEALDYRLCTFDKIVLAEGIEENWDKMSSAISEHLSKDVHYIVNLTGGTKYMVLVVHAIFTKLSPNTEFYYIPFPKNILLKVATNDILPLKTRLTISEYMKNYDVSYKDEKPIKDREYTNKIFGLFTTTDGVYGNAKNELNYNIIKSLRSYRGKPRIKIREIETKPDEKKWPAIPGLSDMIKKIDFIPEQDGFLTKHEIQYLTGGWFEEYIYDKIAEAIRPKDIKLNLHNLHIPRGGSHANELDVVFTYGNKLFVIECKTGIDGEKVFHDMVYKATSIQEAVLGLSANTFIFSLAKSGSNEMVRFESAAKAMGIKYFDRSYFTDAEKFEELMVEIRNKAKD
jgi:hypothetical protein